MHWTVELSGADEYAIVTTSGTFTAADHLRMIEDIVNRPGWRPGTAFGFFNLVSGLALLLASVVAGLLWDQLGASFTFVAGATFSAVALAGLLAVRR